MQTRLRLSALTLSAGPIDFKKWQPVYNERGVMILKNSRPMPRAWLVSNAEAVEAEEALLRIRGLGERPFDPGHTVLLEVNRDKLPLLSGRPLSVDSSVRMAAYEPNRLLLETDSPEAAVLVVSELDYPGWMATIDGQSVPIHTANYLFRSVVLPAGRTRSRCVTPRPPLEWGCLSQVSHCC